MRRLPSSGWSMLPEVSMMNATALAPRSRAEPVAGGAGGARGAAGLVSDDCSRASSTVIRKIAVMPATVSAQSFQRCIVRSLRGGGEGPLRGAPESNSGGFGPVQPRPSRSDGESARKHLERRGQTARRLAVELDRNRGVRIGGRGVEAAHVGELRESAREAGPQPRAGKDEPAP